MSFRDGNRVPNYKDDTFSVASGARSCEVDIRRKGEVGGIQRRVLHMLGILELVVPDLHALNALKRRLIRLLDPRHDVAPADQCIKISS